MAIIVNRGLYFALSLVVILWNLGTVYGAEPDKRRKIFYVNQMNKYGKTIVCENMEHMKKAVDNLNLAFKKYKDKEFKDLDETEREKLLALIDNRKNIAFNIKKGEDSESRDVSCALPLTFYFLPFHYEKTLESEIWSMPVDPNGKRQCYGAFDGEPGMCRDPVKIKRRSIQGKVFFDCEDDVNLKNHKEKCESSWDGVHVQVDAVLKVIEENDDLESADLESAEESIPTYQNGKPLKESAGAENSLPPRSGSAK